MRQTIVVENMEIANDTDDLLRAKELLQAINPTVPIVGVFRERPRIRSDGNQMTVHTMRPPILKILLNSEIDKKKILRSKSNLSNDILPLWMRRCYVRPLLPLADRIFRGVLSQVAFARNDRSFYGSTPDKKNRFIVWLNPFTETYEFRQLQNGLFVNRDVTIEPTDTELLAAEKLISDRRKLASTTKNSVRMDQMETDKPSENQ